MANTTPLVTTITKPTINPAEANSAPRVNIQEFCEEQYEDILPIIIEKVRHDRRKDVHTRLDFGEGPRERSAFDRLSDTYSPSTTKSRPQRTDSRDSPRDRGRTRTLSVSRDDHHKDRECLHGTRESVWFDELPPESIDGYKDLKATFLAYFIEQKKYVKDPVEIHNIKQRDGETIEDFMERFKIETGRMKEAPECMRISGFMHGVNNPELTKCLNEHVPKTMEEMMITTTAFIRGEAAAASKKKVENRKKETAAKDKPTAIYMVQSWQRTMKQNVTQSFERGREIAFPQLTASNGTEGPLVIEAEMGGHMIHRMHIDGGSSMEILYEHCFNKLRPEIKGQMVPATTSLTGFSGETIWPLGQLKLLVTIRDATHSTKAWMNFMVVKSMSPYNGIIGRPGLKAIQAVPSTVHGMLKFPVEGGIATIRSTILIPTECASVTTSSVTPEERTRPANVTVALHPDFPEQEVVIGGSLSDKGRTELCSVLKKNLDIFAWQPSDMTGRGKAPERARAMQAEVQKLVDAEIMREVYYHDWLSNPVMRGPDDGKRNNSKADLLHKPGITGSGAKLFTNREIGYVTSLCSKEAPTGGCKNGALCWESTKSHIDRGQGVEFTYALRFQFAASNNEAEYEAPVAGLRIATQMGVKNIQVNVDSKLVANQVLGTYVAKEDNMIKYLEIVKGLVSGFTTFSISQMMKYYNARVRGVAFKPGDFVYRSNDVSHAVAGGKLRPKWEGPYEVTEALSNEAYKLRSTDGTVL
nr:reverse transcriptase domain-containing protein [Tanacetum cinerariifolium]